jgi:3D (Asp-Asp-Asp) domain-containing protein
LFGQKQLVIKAITLLLMFYLSKIYSSQIPLFIAVVCLALEALFPQVAIAGVSAATVSEVEDYNQADQLTFPVSRPRSARYVTKVLTTAYSSTPDQTDDTPFITASGSTVRRGVVAANWLPFGAKVRLPDYFGEEIFVVEDRMNARYDRRLDIWMATRDQAVNWGVRQVRLEVL